MNSFFQLILRFTNDNSEKQDSYEIYSETKDAKLSDYMKRPEKDQDFPKVRDYNDDVDELGLFSGSKRVSVHSQESENLSNSSKNDNSTSSVLKDEQVKYVKVILPITRGLYRKITNLRHNDSSDLDIEEIYEVIMSNLFTVLDNRQVIVLRIYLSCNMSKICVIGYINTILRRFTIN
ncbi:putative LRR containing protein [Trachipleistophora hominis]|uniref:Putative LRR containing protein n=1 Tax=Trachipleistophora hominis TaxID=72359 RepID=L7JWE1_TRAHO|nr:putative LRR containing protein [Trachipleistophora hominis]